MSKEKDARLIWVKRRLHRLVCVYTCRNAQLLEIKCRGSIVFLLSCGSFSLLCLILVVPWVGPQCVIVAFPGHTHFLVEIKIKLSCIDLFTIYRLNTCMRSLIRAFPMYMCIRFLKRINVFGQHEICDNVVGTNSKASDQPAHIRSLIRAFASRLNIL